MGFYNPFGLLAFLALPMIVLMYLLKQKYKEKEVSSLFIWQKVFLESKSQEPFQKLRKNRLLFLQLLAMSLLAFAMCQPYVMGEVSTSDSLFILDTSFSMQAKDLENEYTRFETAKQALKKQVSDMPQNAIYSFMTLGEEPSILIQQSSDKQELLRLLDGLEAGFGTTDMIQAEEILRAEKNRLEGAVVRLFSDTHGLFAHLITQEYIYNGQGDNTAITLLSHVQADDEELSVLVKLEHHEMESEIEIEEIVSEKTMNLSLYVDNIIHDTITFTPQGTQTDIIFEGVANSGQTFMAKLNHIDALQEDNVFYMVREEAKQQKALLISEDNIFLEKVLNLLPMMDFYTMKSNQFETLQGYDLYIFDGVVPDMLPTDGYILFINPPQNAFFGMKEEMELTEAMKIIEANFSATQQSMQSSFYVQKATPLQADWGQPFLSSGGEIYGLYGDLFGRKTAVMSFDLLESDFPLSMDFPILFHQLVSWYFDDMTGGNYAIGDSILFSLLPNTQKAWVITPSDREIQIAPPFPANILSNMEERGIYFLVEEDERGNQTRTSFGVNASIKESNLKELGTVVMLEENQHENIAVKTIEVGQSLQNLFLMLLLACMMIEWWVSCREN